VDFEALIGKVVRIAELERRRYDAEAELADALRRTGPAHPEVKGLQQRLAVIEAGLKAELGDTDRLLGDEGDIERRRATADRELRDLRKNLGPKHPSVLSKEAEIAALDERLRKVAAATLGAGREQDLLAAIADTPAHLMPYFDLARLYTAAGRLADAERVLTDALARLKQSGGR
jgi:uncharacterized protein involved in exopolysaccharide biosynthesis